MKKSAPFAGLAGLVVGLLPLTSFAGGPPDLVAEVSALASRADRALVDGDVEAVLELYAEDAQVLPNGHERLLGRKAIRQKMLADRDAGLGFESFTSRILDAWECGGTVFAVGTYALSARVPGSDRPVADRGKSLSVWRRGPDGELKVLYDIWNTDLPPGP